MTICKEEEAKEIVKVGLLNSGNIVKSISP